MKEYIEERVLLISDYILKTEETVRGVSKKFSVSKSTVHKDVTERLLEIDKNLHSEVKKVLEKNLSQRHLRGGLATKEKYAKAKRKSEIF